MSLAIKITEAIKQNNVQLWVQNSKVGDIIVRQNYPNRFYVSEHVVGGYKGRTDLHAADGWKPFEIPQFNAVTQKLGDKIETQNAFTFEVLDLTAQEVSALQENSEQNEAREKLDRYRFKGGELIERVRSKMWRRVHKFQDGNNGLTRAQVGKLDRWFQEVYNCLLVGNYREARRLIRKIAADRGAAGDSTLLETPGMLDTAEWFKSKIEDYFDNNYDL